MSNPSWEQLEVAADTVPKQVVRELQLMPFSGGDYDRFVATVERALNHSIVLLTAKRNIVAGKGGSNRMDEDQITALLCGPLEGMLFEVHHSKNSNGNVDINIQGPFGLVWLGEAKIFTSYGKLMGGYQQLVDRYSTGMTGQLNGGFVIYMFGEKVASMMQEWQKYLVDERAGLSAAPVPDFPLQFRSVEPHRATEQPVSVRHMPIPLFHSPTDRAAPPKRKRAGKSA